MADDVALAWRHRGAPDRLASYPGATSGSGSRPASRRPWIDLDGELTALRPRMLATARRITRDGDAASDVVQRAFLKVFVHVDRYEGRAAFSTWVGRIVSNEALVWQRERRRRERLEAHALVCAPWRDDPPKPNDLFESKRARERMRRAMAALPPRDRELIEHTLDADRSTIARLGRETGVGARTLRSRLHRARGRLRRLLEAP